MSCCASSKKDKELSSCPQCQTSGQPVDLITPRHTLKKEFRNTISNDNNYHFCETPDCKTVYFSGDGLQHFTTEQLINHVTCKDPSLKTPLCYCYKITKGDALKEYQASGESTVIQQIEQKMAEKPCFCDKSNPRGVCCTGEIKNWLKKQNIKQREIDSKDSSCNSHCC